MAGKVITFMICNPFSDAATSLLCFEVIFVRESNRNSFWNRHVMSSYAFQVFVEKIYYTFEQELDKLFWARLKENIFAFPGNVLQHLENRQIFVSAGPEYKTLKEWVPCLYKNVIDPLLRATSRLKNDYSERMLLLNTSQLAPIWVLSLH